jgi:hypothetical protein
VERPDDCDDWGEQAIAHLKLGVSWIRTMANRGMALADWLCANNRSRFLLTTPPLRLPGAVGSPTTPIATV